MYLVIILTKLKYLLQYAILLHQVIHMGGGVIKNVNNINMVGRSKIKNQFFASRVTKQVLLPSDYEEVYYTYDLILFEIPALKNCYRII